MVFKLLSAILLCAQSVWAANGVPQLVPFQGRLTDPTGVPINYPVTVKYRVYPPTGSCYIYEDTQSVTPNAFGIFSVLIGGSGNSSGPANSFGDIFSNSATGIPNSCASVYIPVANDWRRIEVLVDGVPFSDMQTVGAAPFSFNSNMLEGKRSSDFILKDATVTQAALTSLLNGSDASALHNHDAQYAKLDGSNSYTGDISTSGGIGVGTSSVTADVDIQKNAPRLRLGAATGGGGTSAIEFYSGTTTQRARIESSENTNVLRFFTGSTEAMSLDANKNLYVGGSLKVSGTVGMGAYTSVQDATLVGQLSVLGVSATGSMWIDSTSGKLRYWDGAAAKSLLPEGSVVETVTASTGLANSGTATAPVLSVAYGSAAGTAIQGNATFGGDVSGSYTNLTVDKIKGRLVDETGIAANKILKYDGTKWTMADDLAGWTATDSSYSTKGVVQFNTDPATSGMNVVAGVATVNAGTGANQIVKLDGTAKLPAVDGSQVTDVVATDLVSMALTGIVQRNGAGSYSAVTVNGPLTYLAGALGVNVGTGAGSVAAGDDSRITGALQRSGGTMTGAINMGSNDLTATGYVLMSSQRALGLGTYSNAQETTLVGTLNATHKGYTWFNSDSNQVKFWNGASAQAVGVAGAGITSFGGQTGNSQSLAMGTSGTAPAWNSAADTHTLNIPMASAAGVTAGLLNKTDYDAFAAKQPAGNYVTALTGDVTATGPGSVAATIAAGAVNSSKILNGTIVSADMDFTGVNTGTSGFAVVDATGKFFNFSCATPGDVPTWTAGGFACQAPAPLQPDLNSGMIWVGNGSNDATAVTMSGDATLSNTGALTLATSGVTAGTYSKVTVDAKGRVTVGANIASGDVTTALGFTPLNKAGDVMTGLLGLNGVASDPAGLTGADEGKIWFRTDLNEIRYWNGSAAVALGVAGAGITSFGGQSGNSQSLAIGTSGTAPAWSSASDTHTLNIPMASTAGVTAGLLNKTDYDAFAAKQPAGSYVTALTGDVTAAGPGSAAATIAAGAVNSSKILNGTIVGADMDFTGVNTATSGFAMVDATGRFYNFACATTGHVPTWTAGGFSCQAPTPLLPSLNDGKIWIGDAANDATAHTVSGDATLSNAGVVTVTNVRVDRLSSAAGQYLSYKPNDVACSNNEVLKWNGTGWICGTDNAGTGTVTGVSAAAPLASSGGATPQISISSGSTSGETLRWNGTNWVAAQLSNADVTGLGSLATKNAVDLGTADATGTLAAARMPALTGDVTSSAGSVATTLANSGVTAGTYSKVTVDAKGRVTVGANIASGDVTTALGFTPLNKAGDVMSGLLGLNGVGSDPGGLTGADEGKMWFRTDTNEIKYWNGSAAVALGVAGAGITSLGGESGNSQSLAIGTSGTAPAWNSASDTHTLNIPMASAAGVTAGLLNKTDYDAFAAKQPAGNYVTALTGDVTATGPGSVAATIAANAVTSAKIANGTIVGADMDFTGVNTATTGFAMMDATGKFYNFACATTGHVPTWTAGGFACQAPAPLLPDLNDGTIWVGNGSNDATAVTMSGDATLANTGALTLATSGVTAGTYSKVTVDAKGRVTTGANIASGDVTTALGFTPLNKAGDVMTGLLGLNGVGSDPGGLTGADEGKMWFRTDTNEIKYWNGSAAIALGVAGAGITSLGGESGNAQTLAIGTTGTAPAWSSASDTHTLNIPMASAAGVTAGLLNKTDYDAFAAKQPAGNYVTALTGDVTATGPGSVAATIAANAVTSAKIANGTIVGADMDFTGVNTGTSGFAVVDATGKFYNFACATTGHVPTWTAGGFACQAPAPLQPALADGKIWIGDGANAATAQTLSGDATLANTGALTLATSGVTAGTYSKVTVDAKGRVTVGANIASGDVTTALGFMPLNKAGDAMTGALTINATNEVRFADSDSSNYVALKSPGTVASNISWTLPDADGSAGQVLKTDGAGVLSWVSVSASAVTNVSSANADIGVASGSSTPVLTLNSGTGANQIVKMDGTAKLPAVDGSQLTDVLAVDFVSLATTGIVQRNGAGSYSTVTVNSPLSYAAGALGVSVGTASGTVAAGDDSRITGALQKSGGTMTGALNMGSQNITNANSIVGASLSTTGNASVGGTLTVTTSISAPSFNYTSDGRLKKDVVAMTGLETILRLRGVRFNWIKDGRPEVGLIAQEVEKVVPELVVTDPVTGFKSVKYGSLVSPLIQSTKELYGLCSENSKATQKVSRELASLKDEVKTLKEENADLRKEMQEIKKMLLEQRR